MSAGSSNAAYASEVVQSTGSGLHMQFKSSTGKNLVSDNHADRNVSSPHHSALKLLFYYAMQLRCYVLIVLHKVMLVFGFILHFFASQFPVS